MFLAETVCSPEGCHEEVIVHPVIALIIGVVVLAVLGVVLWKFVQMWKRPARAAVTTVIWCGVVWLVWPSLGWIPLAVACGAVLVPLGILLGLAVKYAPARQYWCEFCYAAYTTPVCPVHGEQIAPM